MILPIGDDNSDRRTTPVVNYVLIAVNILVFVFLQQLGNNPDFTYAFSTVPEEIITGQDIVTDDQTVEDPVSGSRYRLPGLRETPISVYITLITSIFMHGGLAHILGNMLYLFIFGDNIEDRLGHGKYLAFYLLTGVLASLAHVFSSAAFGQNLEVPSLGASGAISAVLGAYLVLFPRKRVHVILVRILTTVPAVVAIGMWFLFQLLSGIGALGAGSQAGGVAYAAHIGGFVAGAALIGLFTRGNQPSRSSSYRRRR